MEILKKGGLPAPAKSWKTKKNKKGNKMKQTVRDIYANRLEELQYQHKMGFISDKEYVDERIKALQIYTTAMILEAWRLNQIMKEEMIEKISSLNQQA